MRCKIFGTTLFLFVESHGLSVSMTFSRLVSGLKFADLAPVVIIIWSALSLLPSTSIFCLSFNLPYPSMTSILFFSLGIKTLAHSVCNTTATLNYFNQILIGIFHSQTIVLGMLLNRSNTWALFSKALVGIQPQS